MTSLRTRKTQPLRAMARSQAQMYQSVLWRAEISNRDLFLARSEASNKSAMLRLLADNTDEMVQLFDSRGRCAFATSSARGFFGIPTDEWLWSVDSVERSQGHECIERLFRSVLDYGGQPEEDCAVRDRHGRERWLQINARRVPLPNQRGMGVLVVARDVSEMKRNQQVSMELAQVQFGREQLLARQRAEANADRHQALFNSIVHSVVEGLVLLHGDMVRFVNPQFTQLLGFSADESVGRRVYELFPEIADLGKLTREVVSMPRSLSGEIELRRRDGQLIWVRYSIARVDGKQRRGAPEFVISLQDISEQRAAQRMLVEASEAKSTFLANVSHELRTPMNAILGYAYLLGQGGLTEEQDAQLSRITVAATHLQELVSDVLDLSRIEAGGLTLERADFSLGEVLREAIGMVDASASEKGIAVRLEYDPGPENLYGDALRLRQAVLNYLSNAVKFTERGEIVLAASSRMCPDGLVQVGIEVRDTGIGIDEQVQQKLFTPFVQADASIMRCYGGTGLGLAITRRLAQAMDGETGVRSRVGSGSTFWMNLRLSRARHASGSPGRNQSLCMEDAGAVLQRSHAGARVLLAEDDPASREMMRLILGQVDLEVAVAEDGGQVVPIASSRRFDLVLMDMQMPVKSGLQACAEIRRLPGYRDVPIIALTANAFEEDRQACLAAGMSGFATKPVDPNRLYRHIAEALEARSQ